MGRPPTDSSALRTATKHLAFEQLEKLESFLQGKTPDRNSTMELRRLFDIPFSYGSTSTNTFLFGKSVERSKVGNVAAVSEAIKRHEVDAASTCDTCHQAQVHQGCHACDLEDSSSENSLIEAWKRCKRPSAHIDWLLDDGIGIAKQPLERTLCRIFKSRFTTLARTLQRWGPYLDDSKQLGTNNDEQGDVVEEDTVESMLPNPNRYAKRLQIVSLPAFQSPMIFF